MFINVTECDFRGVQHSTKMPNIGFLKKTDRTEPTSKFKKSKTRFPRFGFQKPTQAVQDGFSRCLINTSSFMHHDRINSQSVFFHTVQIRSYLCAQGLYLSQFGRQIGALDQFFSSKVHICFLFVMSKCSTAKWGTKATVCSMDKVDNHQTQSEIEPVQQVVKQAGDDIYTVHNDIRCYILRVKCPTFQRATAC